MAVETSLNGSVMRHERRMKGTATRGRRRLQMLHDLTKRVSYASLKLKKARIEIHWNDTQCCYKYLLQVLKHFTKY